MFENVFSFLCLSIVLLVTTGSQASDQVAQPQNPFDKFQQEATNIFKDFTSFINGEESSPTSQTSIYSDEEYGPLAVFLNKFKQMMEFSKQETRAAAQALKEIGNVFTDDVFFDFSKLIDKKKKLERLSIFLDESEKRTENVLSEYKAGLLSSPDLDEVSRQYLLECHYKNAEKNKFIRKENYKIKKNIANEFIKMLGFLSKIYGTYEKRENGQIICANDNDASILNAHVTAIENFIKEETSLTLLNRQHLMEISKPLFTTTYQDSEKVQRQTANAVIEAEKIFKEFWNREPSKMTSISTHTTEEYGPAAFFLDRFQQFMELCKQEALLLDQAAAEIDVNSICTEKVFFDLTKINERKKKLEQMCVTIDESEIRLEKYKSDFFQWILSVPYLDEQYRKELKEDFNKTTPVLGKRSFAIQKEYTLEFIKLLNFLSIRYGTYKLVNNNQDLFFCSEIESKRFESYIRKIKQLFREKDEVDLLIDQQNGISPIHAKEPFSFESLETWKTIPNEWILPVKTTSDRNRTV